MMSETQKSKGKSHVRKGWGARTPGPDVLLVGLMYSGCHSMTLEAITTQIAERCHCDIVLDAFCGNAIASVQTSQRGTLFLLPPPHGVDVDTSSTLLMLARHNAAVADVMTQEG